MTILLKRIVEQYGAETHLYDIGRDFANFRRTIDGSFDQIKQRFEQIIGSRLSGKRIRARASRGYKQYVKDYEFDVSKVTLDDYYDNYVVVAHDNSSPKPKEYFLKPGFKIQVLGSASGQPNQGEKKEDPNISSEQPVSPKVDPDGAQAQPMSSSAVNEPGVREASSSKSVGTGHFDAYPIDTIEQDIKGWLSNILIKPEESIRDFIKGLGWLKSISHGKSIALFDLKLPIKGVKVPLNAQTLQKLLSSADKHGSTIDTTYQLVKAEEDEQKEEMSVRVKKTMIDKSAI
jgi:hypothetical protein